jgi:ribonucleoside-diphosphate reductase alpha chain
LPLDRYKKTVDGIVSRKPTMPWESLRESIKEHGLRNCTVTALMPVESTSVIQSSTNGIEPIRAFITYKGSKSNTVPVICPHYSSWKNRYELAFDMKDNIGYLNVVAVIQKWIDMSISANTYYNYEHYENNKLPDTKVIKELMYAYKMGVKTLYYNNSSDSDNQGEEKKEDDCASGACKL